MPKTSFYDEQSPPLGESEVVHSYNGQTQKTKLRDALTISLLGKMNPIQTEFIASAVDLNHPFRSSLLITGTLAQLDTENNHPGIWRITSAAGANSGGAFEIFSATKEAVGIWGGETLECIFRAPSLTDTVSRIGFTNGNGSIATYGACIDISGTTLTGKTVEATVSSTTPTSHTISTNTWYRVKVAVNSDATLITFYLYDENGSLLWSDSLSTNIAAGFATFVISIYSIKTTAGATAIFDVDYFSMWNGRYLER